MSAEAQHRNDIGSFLIRFLHTAYDLGLGVLLGDSADFASGEKLAGLSLRKKILLAVVDPLDRKLNSCLHSLLNGAEL